MQLADHTAPSFETFAAELEARVRRAIHEELSSAAPSGPTALPPLLDLAGAAARLNVSERTVEALIALGEIPVVRIGTGRGVRRFDHAAIETFIRRRVRSL